jgi:ribokinase
MDLLVVGDANADLVLRGGDIVPRFGQREQLVEDAELVLGGSGAILAVGAAKLGLDVAMVACVGDDPLGRAMRDELTAAGVDVSAVKVVDAPTGVSVGLVRDDDRSMLTATGALAHLHADDVPDELLKWARHVHVASPFLQDGLRPGLGELVERASGTTSLDPGWDPRERWDVPLDAFDVLLPNAEEALRLAGEDDVEAAARALAARGPLVVVKLGPEGALAVRGGEVTRVRAPRVEAVDSTGAGDSFDAGFLAAWLGGERARGGTVGGATAGGETAGGHGLEAALTLACACGALSTRRAGGTAAQPTLDEARALA